LKYIADEDLIFVNPVTGYDNNVIFDSKVGHIDAAYEGSDYTAFTIGRRKDGKFYLFGKMWRKHVDDCADEILYYMSYFRVYRIYCENNGDKGYLAKDLRNKGVLVSTYHEKMNKILKIATNLKFNWGNVVFVEGTDPEYIDQIRKWTEDAEHDDAPDSASCVVRLLSNQSDGEYKSIFG
jgi:predicted phage terminase large subunit-like protein